MKKALGLILVLSFCFSSIAGEEKSKKMLALECGGKSILVPISVLWGQVPFFGNPQAMYKYVKTGENSDIIYQQNATMGLNGNGDVSGSSVNYGILAPYMDLMNISLSSLERLLDDTKRTRRNLKDALELPTIKQNLAPAGLIAKQANEVCSELSSRLAASNEGDRNDIKEVSRSPAIVKGTKRSSVQ